MDNFLATLEGSPVWERFMLHAYYLKYPKTNLSRDNKEECKSATAFMRNSFDLLSEVFQLAALVDWLDTQQIYVETYKAKHFTSWRYSVERFMEFNKSEYDFNSRSEAAKAGIVKAFEILENK